MTRLILLLGIVVYPVQTIINRSDKFYFLHLISFGAVGAQNLKHTKTFFVDVSGCLARIAFVEKRYSFTPGFLKQLKILLAAQAWSQKHMVFS